MYLFHSVSTCKYKIVNRTLILWLVAISGFMLASIFSWDVVAGQAEGAGLVQPGEKKALGRPHGSVPLLKESL